MEKTADQGGEQHKYTSGFFGHQPGSTESAAPLPMGKQALKGWRVRTRKARGTFQCYGNHVDRYLQAAGPVTTNKKTHTAEPGNAALLAKNTSSGAPLCLT